MYYNGVESKPPLICQSLPAGATANCQQFLHIGIKWDVEHLRYSTSGPPSLSVTSSFLPSHPLSCPVLSPPWSGGSGMLLPENVLISALLSCVCRPDARTDTFVPDEGWGISCRLSQTCSWYWLLIKHNLDCRHQNKPPSGAHRSDMCCAWPILTSDWVSCVDELHCYTHPRHAQ